jgi:hypothetical protein
MFFKTISQSDGGWEHLIIVDKIEFFWISKDECEAADMLWAIDGSGAKVCSSVVVFI